MAPTLNPDPTRPHSSDVDTCGPEPNPTKAPHTEPRRPNPGHRASPSPPADLAPQFVLLEAAIKPEPATYAESCGAKSIVPPKRRSVNVANLPAHTCSTSAH